MLPAFPAAAEPEPVAGTPPVPLALGWYSSSDDESHGVDASADDEHVVYISSDDDSF